MENKMNFVRTDSEEIAEELRKFGYTEIEKQGTLFCFLNDGKQVFSEDINKNIEYTNKTAMVV